MATFRVSCALAMIAFCVLSNIGCAAKKGVIKDSLGADATDQERKELALKLFKEGAGLLFEDNEAALTKFDQARELDPTFVAAYFNAGIALEMLGRLADATLRYDACLVQDKVQSSCLDNWVLAKAGQEQFDEAEQKVEQYLNEFPEAPFAMVSAAKLALARKDYARAERYARQAIEREAENVEALFVMSHVFYERKQYPAAKWVLKNALEIAPSHGGLHLALGHTEAALGLLHDALDSYALAVKTQPTDEALEAYGLLLLKRGRVTEALPVLKRLAEIRPQDSRNMLHLGNAYMANKMFDEAKVAYLSALEKKPDNLDVNFNLGLLYYDLKPNEVAEIDRLKAAKSYFEAYMKKPGLSKDRQTEVKEYLQILTQKIEMEEYAAESAKEAEEEAAKVQEEAEGEGATKPEVPEKGNDIETESLPEEPANTEDKKASPLPPSSSSNQSGSQEKDRAKEKKEQQEQDNEKRQIEGFEEEEGSYEDL